MTADTRRFACTGCGACCNRAPEVELSETWALADRFIFRLMIRAYDLPASLTDLKRQRGGAMSPLTQRIYLEQRASLSRHASKAYPVRLHQERGSYKATRYLYISALALDFGDGHCSALDGGRCTIHDRRPVACRSVPLHYSTPDAALVSTFDAFVATPAHQCDTGPEAELLLQRGKLVHPEYQQARDAARELMRGDQAWKAAIAAAIEDQPSDWALPDWTDIDRNAASGATTLPIIIAWQIAREAGLVETEVYQAACAAQRSLLTQTIASRWGMAEERDGLETLQSMAADYEGG